jgi:hypothetical protein
MLALIILAILLTWLLSAAVCIGIGPLLHHSLRFTCTNRETMWTGLALITAILQIYHFFRPIDLIAVFLFVGLGLAGWVWNCAPRIQDASARRLALLQHRRDWNKSHLTGFLLYIPVTAIIAFRCAAVGEHYDTGLYGAQAVRWFTTYPLVPGLGNLIAQLGFNSSVFLWIAALDQGPWHDLAHHLFDGFLIAALFASIIPAAVRTFRTESNSSSDWFFTLLIVPATIWATTGKIVGTNTDVPTTVICVVAAGILFRALDENDQRAERSTDDFPSMAFLTAMVLFSLAVTFKISIAVFALLGWTVAALKSWSLGRHTLTGKRKIVCAVIFSTAIVLPWIGRGLVLTGYPFFPSSALSIPVDWKVPAFETQTQAEYVRSFARVPEVTAEYAHGWKWLRPWFRELVREREGFWIPLFFTVLGCMSGIVRMMRQNRSSLPQSLWLLLPVSGGLIFWFLEAPAIRFGEPVIWTAGATLGTIAAMHFLNRRGRNRIVLAGLVLLTAWAEHPRLFWNSYFRPSVGVRTFLRLPEAKVTLHQTASGLMVNMPVETNQCWNAPLPCSPYFYETLRLRQPGKVERGFASQEPARLVKWK